MEELSGRVQYLLISHRSSKYQSCWWLDKLRWRIGAVIALIAGVLTFHNADFGVPGTLQRSVQKLSEIRYSDF